METFRKGLGLSARISIGVFLLVAATFAALTFFSSSRVSGEVHRARENASLHELATLERYIDLWFHDYAILLRFNAARISTEKTSGSDAVSIQGLLPSGQQEDTGILQEVFLTDASGTIVAADKGNLPGISIAGLGVWKAFVGKDLPYFVTPYPTRSFSAKNPALMIAAPIRSGAAFRGLLVASLDITGFSRALFKDRGFESIGTFAIMDETSTIIASPDESLIMTHAVPAALAERITASSDAGGSAEFSRDGALFSARWVRLQSMPWYLSVTMPQGETTGFSRALMLIIAGSGAACLLLLIGLLMLLVRLFVTRRIGLLSAALQKAIGGDLSARAVVRSRDEIGMAAASLNALLAGFRAVIDTLNERMESLKQTGLSLTTDMEQTAAAVNQINASIASTENQIAEQSAAVERTSQTAERVSLTVEGLGAMIDGQAIAVTESSAAIEQMVSNIGSVSSSAEQAHAFTGELLDVSGEGKKKLTTVIAAIDQIARQSADLMAAAKLIAGIAANTNLLAMNASIEAAHAGRWGKGFAVVAEEIRHLAEQASRQSREIAKRLSGIKTSIDEVAKTSQETGEAFGIVFEKVEKVGDIVRQIERAMAEQNEGSRQVLDGLKNINDVTVQVQDGSIQMKEGSGQILSSIARLADVNSAVRGNVGEIASGTGEITKAVGNVLDLAVSTKDMIEEVARAAARFSMGDREKAAAE